MIDPAQSLEQAPVATGVPKTGYMIAAARENIVALLAGRTPTSEPTWSTFCLADFGDRGVAFITKLQNPPRNINWATGGMWVHVAKIAFEKYFLHKVRAGVSEPYYEKASRSRRHSAFTLIESRMLGQR